MTPNSVMEEINLFKGKWKYNLLYSLVYVNLIARYFHIYYYKKGITQGYELHSFRNDKIKFEINLFL